MDGEKNKIVVVIISYNGWQYLPDCLRSLEEQTLPPEEIIIPPKKTLVFKNNNTKTTDNSIKSIS